jgi:hypothetical protein
VDSQPGLGAILGTLILVMGVAILLVAVGLAVWTTQGWPKLTLLALALLAVAAVVIARNMRTPS